MPHYKDLCPDDVDDPSESELHYPCWFPGCFGEGHNACECCGTHLCDKHEGLCPECKADPETPAKIAENKQKREAWLAELDSLAVPQPDLAEGEMPF